MCGIVGYIGTKRGSGFVLTDPDKKRVSGFVLTNPDNNLKAGPAASCSGAQKHIIT